MVTPKCDSRLRWHPWRRHYWSGQYTVGGWCHPYSRERVWPSACDLALRRRPCWDAHLQNPASQILATVQPWTVQVWSCRLLCLWWHTGSNFAWRRFNGGLRFNEVIADLLDAHAPIAEITCRVRPSSDRWYDSECRSAKRHARRLERRYKKTLSTAAREHWVETLGSMHQLDRSKRGRYWKVQNWHSTWPGVSLAHD